MEALLRLKKLENVVILKADKGNKVVLLNKDIYLDKAYNLLQDVSTYKKLTFNPLKSSQSFFNKEIKTLLSDNQTLIKKFTSYLPSLSYFYGLPKIHKENIPLRPIISNINCVTYNLAKWIANSLSPLIGCISSAHIKNSCFYRKSPEY
ncbi:UNVERIFIED_CONTAM: hypothetical protein RMT77_005102 [Armadillidium vulgare]